MNKPHDTEIEFLSLIKTIWKGKWIIISITIITSLVGIYYSLTMPNSYQVVTIIKPGKPSTFINYVSINSVLKVNELIDSDSLNDYMVNQKSIFEMFITEFKDYEEMITVLKKNNLVKNSIKNFSDNETLRILNNYAKLFVITDPQSKKKNGIKTTTDRTLTFNWHNATEGSHLFNEAILLTLSNVKSNLIKNYNKLALTIEATKKYQLETMRDKIKTIEQTQDLRMSMRIKYLKEHSDIARELNIGKNTLEGNALDISKFQTLLPPPNVEFSMNRMNDFPYYMRGFKAIDKEISLIQNRSKEDQLLLADKFVAVKSKFLKIKNDSTSSQLINFSKTIENVKPRNWIQFNFALANTKSDNKKFLYVIFSIMLGLLIGSMYVVLSKIIRK